MKKIKVAIAVAIMGLFVGIASACTTQADTVNSNLTKQADSFKIMRRIQFVNGITDKVLLTIEGLCSLKIKTKSVDVTCKVPETTEGQVDGFLRHTFTKADNVFAVSEQMYGANVSSTHYTFIVRPGSLVPDVDVQ